jgi:DNA-binding response OmpR family regulator
MPRHKVLVVDDDTLLAMDMADILSSSTASDVITATTIEQAEKDVSEGLSFAVLDIEVIGGRTFELAKRLREAGVPVLFISGSLDRQVPADLFEIPILQKPFPPEALKRAFILGLKDHRLERNEQSA